MHYRLRDTFLFNDTTNYAQLISKDMHKKTALCKRVFVVTKLLNITTEFPLFQTWQNSMIFPGFLANFQVFFSLFLKYDFQVVLNINMQTYLSFIWTKN